MKPQFSSPKWSKDGGKLNQAMATFQANNPGFNPTVSAQAPDDPTVQAAIAANWHG
jgi:hypothetical protein